MYAYTLNVPSYNETRPEGCSTQPKYIAWTTYYLLYADVVLWLKKNILSILKTKRDDSYKN
jgi:hypothetical protein